MISSPYRSISRSLIPWLWPGLSAYRKANDICFTFAQCIAFRWKRNRVGLRCKLSNRDLSIFHLIKKYTVQKVRKKHKIHWSRFQLNKALYRVCSTALCGTESALYDAVVSMALSMDSQLLCYNKMIPIEWTKIKLFPFYFPTSFLLIFGIRELDVLWS